MTKHSRKVTRRLTPFSPGGPINHRIVIEAGMLLTKIVLMLYGVYTLTGGAASGTAITSNPGGLLQRIQVTATAKAGDYPGGTLKDLTPRGILTRMLFDYGKSAPDLNLGASGISGAAASFTLKTALDLNFCHPHIIRPIETALRLDRYSDLMMKVIMGSRDTLFTGNDRTSDYTGIFLDVIEFREAAGADGSFQPKVVLYDMDRNFPINQANKLLSLDNELQSTNAYIDIVWWFETTNGALSNAILNEMFVKTGTQQFLQSKIDDLRLEQRRYLTDAADADTGLIYTNLAYDLGNDLAELQGAVAELGLTLDVNKPGTDTFNTGSRTVAPVPARKLTASGG